MEALIFIGIIIVFSVYAYFFPKGVRILGIDAETLFKKDKDEKDDDYYS